MNVLTLDEVPVKNKRVLVREDLNVPIKDGLITSDQRIQAALPTLARLLDEGAAVMVLSHLGRPNEGMFDPRYTLQPVADYLSNHLNYPVRFAKDYLDGVDVHPGELVLCENVRFNAGEKENNIPLAKKMADLCDVFVMDAFGTAHRSQASTVGVAKYAPIAVAGPLLEKELAAIHTTLKATEKPIVAIVGGAKVSSKLTLLRQLVTQVDYLIPGGGIANTFLKAQGVEVGRSLVEENLLHEAGEVLQLAKLHNCQITLPVDVVVGKEFAENCPAFNKSLANIADTDMIFDAGPDSISRYIDIIEHAKTIIWNGPIGVFEFPQ